jgi:DNA-binding CsgD family transcriptional regulator/PAS domain-containing protein
MDLETYDELVEAIYDAPFEDLGWHQVVSKLLKVFYSPLSIAGFTETEEAPSNAPLEQMESHPGELLKTLDTSTTSQNHTETHLYRNLSRHIRKAVHIGHRLERITSTNSIFEDVLEQLRLGIVFLDRNAQILQMNSYAKRIIEENGELFEKASRLELSQKKQRDMFRQTLTGGPASGSGHSFSLPRSNRSPLCLCITPFTDKSTHKPSQDNASILFISDPDDQEKVDSAALAKRWNLTALEGEVVLLMIKGLTLKQIAARLTLTENTARWYSKQIMSKVGVKRQAELNLRLMKDIAFLVNTENAKPRV